MTLVSVVVAAAALVVLLAVTASGIGPLMSLRRSLARFGELNEDIESLQRGLERLEDSTRRLQEGPEVD